MWRRSPCLFPQTIHSSCGELCLLLDDLVFHPAPLTASVARNDLHASLELFARDPEFARAATRMSVVRGLVQQLWSLGSRMVLVVRLECIERVRHGEGLRGGSLCHDPCSTCCIVSRACFLVAQHLPRLVELVSVVGRSGPPFGGCAHRGTISAALRRRDETIRMGAEDASAVCEPDLGGGRRRRSTQPQPSVEVDMLAGMARRCWRVQLGCWLSVLLSDVGEAALQSRASLFKLHVQSRRDTKAPRRAVRPRPARRRRPTLSASASAIFSSRLPKTCDGAHEGSDR